MENPTFPLSNDSFSCRICLDSLESPVNYCNCKANVHNECLQRWVFFRPINRKDNNSLKYQIEERVKCEICHCKFNDTTSAAPTLLHLAIIRSKLTIPRKLPISEESDTYLELVFNRTIINKVFDKPDHEHSHNVAVLKLSYFFCLICLCFPPSLLMILIFNDFSATKTWLRSLNPFEILILMSLSGAFLTCVFKTMQDVLDKLVENYYYTRTPTY